MTPEHRKVMEWISKDFESYSYWTNLGQEMFLFANGNCEVTRYRVADALRRSVTRQPPGQVQVQRWNDDFSSIVTIDVEPPAVTVANQLHVDWIRIADYVLLAAKDPFDRLDDENQRRKELGDWVTNSFEKRQLARKIKAFIAENPELSDDQVIEAMRKENKDVLKANIVLARKLADSNLDELEPTPLEAIAGYKSLYF